MKFVAIISSIMALLASSLQAAEPLGRLFFTPAQRNSLDAGKQLEKQKNTAPTLRGPRSVTVNGIVTRSDGESTVWVNGGTTGVKRQNAAAITAKAHSASTARVQVTGTTARLRVGQTLDRTTGKVTELYESRPTASRKKSSGSVASEAARAPEPEEVEPDEPSDVAAPDDESAQH